MADYGKHGRVEIKGDTVIDLDTTNIYSADAFLIGQGKYKKMLMALGCVRFFYDQNVIVISWRGVELGRGATVRQALEDVYQKAEKTKEMP